MWDLAPMSIFINYSLCELFISSQYGTEVLQLLQLLILVTLFLSCLWTCSNCFCHVIPVLVRQELQWKAFHVQKETTSLWLMYIAHLMNSWRREQWGLVRRKMKKFWESGARKILSTVVPWGTLVTSTGWLSIILVRNVPKWFHHSEDH
jgi:hypothetical protein